MSQKTLLISTRQAAEILGVTETMMHAWRGHKIGPPYYKYGRTIRYDEDEVRAYKDETYVVPERSELNHEKS